MEQLYTCAEVAKMYRVKVITVWEWVRTGKLRASKIGRLYRISRKDLEAFAQSKADHSA